ncbi:complement component C8 gamma chain [Conger conger]|uniref:complement component C8 gamma chain n=1 Tax=Conger conger TaxID=82655 RepID=UPI002A5A05A3|nr:complement component C8 gamma chain [Conger conger]
MGRVWLWVCMAMALGLCLSEAENPIDKIPAVLDIDLPKMNGKWFLVSVASKCQYLRENNLRLEGTTIILTVDPSPTSPLSVSTLRKLNMQCWEIRQKYLSTKTSGRFLLKSRNKKNDIDVVIGETDYNSYSILYYQKRGKISIKLYGRSERLEDHILDKFEQLAEKQNLGIDFVFPFPKYGFCQSADEKHVLSL